MGPRSVKKSSTSPAKKPTKVFLTPQETAELAELAGLLTDRRGELVEVSPLARELLVPAVRRARQDLETVPV